MKIKASYTLPSKQQAAQQRQIILRERAREVYKMFCRKRQVTPRIITGFRFSSDEKVCYLLGNTGEGFCKIDLITEWINFN